MRDDLAIFDVDTHEPAENGDGLVVRPRMAPLAGQVEAVLQWARGAGVRRVRTACLNAGVMAESVDPGAVFVPADAADDAWRGAVADAREIWIAKRTCGSPLANRRARAFDLFCANPHIADVLGLLDVSHYAVFGDSAGYCTRSTAEGLLRLGRRVSLLTDAIGPGIDDERRKAKVLDELAGLGAKLASTRDLLAGRL